MPEVSETTLDTWPKILKACRAQGTPELAGTLFLKGRSRVDVAELKWLSKRRIRNRPKLFAHLLPYDELIEMPSGRKRPDQIAEEHELESMLQAERIRLQERFPKASPSCLDRLASLKIHGTTD